MLKELRVKNFKSFKNEILFSMEAGKKVSELNSHIYDNNYGDKLLKVTSIYGPNAGGKTNLLRAINFLKYLQQYIEMINGPEEESLLFRHFNFERFISPFKFNSQNNTIEYSIFFLDDEYELGYNLSVDINIIEKKSFILQENFLYRKLGENEFFDLFNRNKTEIVSDNLISEIGIEQFRLSDNMPFLFYLYKNFVNKNIENSFYLSLIKRFMGQVNSIKFINGVDKMPLQFLMRILKENEQLKHNIISILQGLDISVDDIIFKPFNDREEMFFVHNISNSRCELSIYEESEGTLCLVNLLSRIVNLLDDGGILLCDELDSHLHPKLVAKIIELFTSQYNKKCQLIFNSHDIWNMNSENFRRDEIWFVYRDENLVSEIVSLSDYITYDGNKVRKDAKYSKQYMEGKFGADPFIMKGVLWYGK